MYQSQKRGIVENNLLLTKFAEIHLNSLDDTELNDYEALLNENDWDIYYWLVGKSPIPPEYEQTTIMKRLLNFVAEKYNKKQY